jgi:AraC-like DNA-binding protein
MLALSGERELRGDEVLLTRGLSWPQVRRWTQGALTESAAVRQALRSGIGVGEGGSILPGWMLAVSMPASWHGHRRWLLTATTDQSQNGQAWAQRSGYPAEMLLRSWIAAFEGCANEEAGAGRMVFGHDGRLLHQDAGSALSGLDAAAGSVFGQLQRVVTERWPRLSDRQRHDAALEVMGRPMWVVFHRAAAVSADETPPMDHHALHETEYARHWVVELRPLTETDVPPVGAVTDPRLAAALAFIHDHYHQAPNLERVAQAAGSSPFHFHRLFSRAVGISPKQYVQRRQLQAARQLLRETRTPIGDIAKLAGFASHGHFTSTFHRMMGRNPSEYREA